MNAQFWLDVLLLFRLIVALAPAGVEMLVFTLYLTCLRFWAVLTFTEKTERSFAALRFENGDNTHERANYQMVESPRVFGLIG